MEGLSGRTSGSASSTGRRRFSAIAARPFCASRTVPTKRKPLRGSVFDEALFIAGIADRIPGGVQASRQRGIGDNASVPDGADEVVFADDALPVSNQVIEQVKNLRCDRHRIRPAMQFTPFGVQRVILEEIAQVAIPSGGHL